MLRSLGHLEEQILLVVLGLEKANEKAYGLVIVDRLKGLAVEVVNGTVYNVLSRLENKGLLRSEITEPISIKGGRRKRIYFLENKGLEQLKKCYLKKKIEVSNLKETLGKYSKLG